MSSESIFKNVKKEFEGAERGKGGLKRVTYRSWRILSLAQKIELLEQGPVILTGDDNDATVEMKVEDYFALCPVTQAPGQNPRMMRVDGALYREVL